MLQQYRFAVRTFEVSSNNVTQLKFYFCIRMISAAFFYDVIMKSARLCRKTGERKKSVSMANVQHLCNRADAVGRIEIAIAMYRMIGSPSCFRECFFAKLRTY